MSQSSLQQNAPEASTSPAGENTATTQQTTDQVIRLHPSSRWHDPLKLIQNEPPSEFGRIVLWSVSILIFVMLIWAYFGQLDIIATAEGKLVPQTLVKIVQPAESGVVKELLVQEGDLVKAGQVLARLDTTLATADKTGIASDLAIQQMQVRRIEAELADQPMQPKAGDDPIRFAQVHSQYLAHRKAFHDARDQEKSLLAKVEHERRSAIDILAKLEQTLPTYKRSAEAYAKLEQEGFFGGLAAAEKQREAIEKARDLDAQRSMAASLEATIAAQNKKISQLKSTYQSQLQQELADIRIRIAQLQPNLAKTLYREGLMELKAPQDGIIKDLATTTVGAVVQPGTVIMTLVPQGEELYADVNVKNEDVGFVHIGQKAQIKLAAYPFQKYGMLAGKVVHLSADASESEQRDTRAVADKRSANDALITGSEALYKARIKLDIQSLKELGGRALDITPGMQIVAEINQGKRTVLEYLLSPVQKVVTEAVRER